MAGVSYLTSTWKAIMSQEVKSLPMLHSQLMEYAEGGFELWVLAPKLILKYNLSHLLLIDFLKRSFRFICMLLVGVMAYI